MKPAPADCTPQDAAGNNLQITGEGRIGSLCFQLGYKASLEEKILRAALLPSDGKANDLTQLATAFSGTGFEFKTPAAISDFGLSLNEVAFLYEFEKSIFSFRLGANGYGTLVITIRLREQATSFGFKLEINKVVPFSNFPLLGDGAAKGDRISLDWFEVRVGTDKSIALGARFTLVFGGHTIPLTIFQGEKNGGILSAGSEPDVKWLDINKDIGPAHIARLGFALGSGSITAYVDAGLQLSLLLLEVLSLQVTIPLKKGVSVAFGIQGLAVSVKKDPLFISGGFYRTEESGIQLYSGQLSVRFKKIQLSAMGSYGKLPGGDASLFAFLMVGAPLGGPPIFYITGLAGGFGYNRSIRLPSDVRNVKDFPFVAAALSTGTLKKEMTPAEVLRAMNKSIPPDQGQYFASIGLRFSSFGMLDSFMLLNVLLGKKFELSLLGTSTLSIPPKAADPFVFVQLAIMAVIAPEDGYVSVQGALSSESYLLDKNCKLQGGFAFFTWFGSNPHCGDFVLTLGGYKNGFEVAHYPKVDRVGIRWNMGNNLLLQAQFYFALTPSCVMLGGRASITYEWGRLKAWFRAGLEFYMKWKPFAYEFCVAIGIGASFRWDFFPFYKTFTLELGADLRCWGPPFGGKVRISWFIISFTVSFGGNKPAEEALSWTDFADAFLVKENTKTNGGRPLLTVRATGGDAQSNEVAAKTPLYSKESLALEITTLLPCTEASVNGTPLRSSNSAQEALGALGVVPMKLDAYTSPLTVKVQDTSGQTALFTVTALYGNVPRALWDTKKPDPYNMDGLKSNQLQGVRLTVPAAEAKNILPAAGAYSMEVLCRNERLNPLAYRWARPHNVPPKKYPGNVLPQIEASIVHSAGRDSLLATLATAYQVERETDLSGWGSDLAEILLAEPTLQKLGACFAL